MDKPKGLLFDHKGESIMEFENDFKIIPEDIKDKISTKTKWIIINSPSNPTGSSYSKEELKNIGDLILNYKNIT